MKGEASAALKYNNAWKVSALKDSKVVKRHLA
jgi:hypothetical protein